MVRTSAATTVMLRVPLVAVCGGELESASRTVKLLVPAVVGVPEMPPVLGLSVNPAGKVPEARDQVSGVLPPVPTRVAL